jgi:hypothetical protein
MSTRVLTPLVVAFVVAWPAMSQTKSGVVPSASSPSACLANYVGPATYRVDSAYRKKRLNIGRQVERPVALSKKLDAEYLHAVDSVRSKLARHCLAKMTLQDVDSSERRNLALLYVYAGRLTEAQQTVELSVSAATTARTQIEEVHRAFSLFLGLRTAEGVQLAKQYLARLDAFGDDALEERAEGRDDIIGATPHDSASIQIRRLEEAIALAERQRMRDGEGAVRLTGLFVKLSSTLQLTGDFARSKRVLDSGLAFLGTRGQDSEDGPRDYAILGKKGPVIQASHWFNADSAFPGRYVPGSGRITIVEYTSYT